MPREDRLWLSTGIEELNDLGDRAGNFAEMKYLVNYKALAFGMVAYCLGRALRLKISLQLLNLTILRDMLVASNCRKATVLYVQKNPL